MSDVIQLFYNPQSRARIAHWALEEFGEPYEMKVLSLEKAEHKSPDYMKLNPMGKIPAIIHRGHVVTEVAAILTYLGDAFPEKRLAPTIDDPRRASYLRWMFFMATNWEAAVLDRNFPRQASVPKSVLGYGSYDDTAHAVETAIGSGRWVTGDQFTMVDLLIGAQLGWALFMKTIEPRPSFVEYVERCQARPAWKRSNDHAMAMIEKARAQKP